MSAAAEEPVFDPLPGQRLLGPLLAAALFIEVSIAVIGTGLRALDSEGPTLPSDFGSPGSIGTLLLERFLIAFEAASMLLLIAAVGAIVLAGRKRRNEEPSEDGGTPGREAEEVAA